jgi:hypothetical protein
MAEAARQAADAVDQNDAPEPIVDDEPAEVAVETVADERLGGGRDDGQQQPQTGDDKDGTHRPSRAALRRQAQRRYQQRLQRENEELRTTVQQLARGQNEIYQRLNGNDGATIEAQLSDVDAKLQTANAILAKARNSAAPTADQDFVEALNIRDQLVEARRNLYTAKQYREQAAREPQRQAQPAADTGPKARFAARFVADHADWYDPRLSNRESKIAERLSSVLDAEGDYDPNTKEYWDELDKRVHAHPQLAHLFDDGGGADDDDGTPVEPEPQVRRQTNGNAAPARNGNGNGGPRLTVAGRERPLKRGEVRVPKELKDNMIEAGQWDDPKVRARVIARYQEAQRQQRQQ